MASNIGELLLLFTFLSILVSSVSYYYEAVLGFENKVPISEPIDNRYADSVVRCAMSCGSGCKCFNFNHHTGMCISYHSCHAFNMTVNELGWQLYYRPPLNTLDYEENVAKNLYCFIKSSTNSTNAKEKCHSFRSHLLEINTEAEQIWFNDKVSGGGWWMGGVPVKDENGVNWIWENSSTQMNFTNWDIYQPNNFGEECVIMSGSGRWSDISCTYAFNIVCEMRYK